MLLLYLCEPLAITLPTVSTVMCGFRIHNYCNYSNHWA